MPAEGLRGQWFPPNEVMKHRELINARLESCPADLVPWEFSVPPLTYFNNVKQYAPYAAYDSFFDFTPGWDQRTRRGDRRDPEVIRQHIHEEERDKKVPVLTSLVYGRPCRAQLEGTLKGNGIVTAAFGSRNGTNMAVDLEPTVLPTTCGHSL